MTLIGVDPVGTKKGWHPVRHAEHRDIADVLVPGRRVKLEGTVVTTRHVASVDRERRLVAILEDGYSHYMDRMAGSRHVGTNVKVYRYEEVKAGNEVHVSVYFAPVLAFNLKEGTGW
jgi:hypothetical protein